MSQYIAFQPKRWLGVVGPFVPMHKWHKYIDRFNVFVGGKFKACHIFSMSPDNEFEFVASREERLPMVPPQAWLSIGYFSWYLLHVSCVVNLCWKMGFKLWTKPQLRHKYFVVLVKGEKWDLDYGLEDIKVTNVAMIEFH